MPTTIPPSKNTKKRPLTAAEIALARRCRLCVEHAHELLSMALKELREDNGPLYAFAQDASSVCLDSHALWMQLVSVEHQAKKGGK